MRKGYFAEYFVKKILIKEYGKVNVIKVAIGGSEDFFCIKNGKIDKVVEVKETVKNKYYPSLRDKLQINKIKRFAKKHNVRAELFIVFRRGKGRSVKLVKSPIYIPKHNSKN